MLYITSTKPMTVQNEHPETPTTDRIMIEGQMSSNDTVTLTLSGINITYDSGMEPTFQIQYGARFNVHLLLADDSKNILKSGGYDAPAIEKSCSGRSFDPTQYGTLTIGVPEGSKANGSLLAEATRSSGIGASSGMSACNIIITGGIITAQGGMGGAAGIGGGGEQGEVANITIAGGIVTAIGGTASDKKNAAAGIGGGFNNAASNISVTGGIVTATGGNGAPAVGGGTGSSGSSNNKLDGDAVLIATSGSADTAALDSSFTTEKGIVFTRKGEESEEWQSEMRGETVTITEPVDFPASLTVPEGTKLVIAEEVTVTVPEGSELVIKGDIENNGEVEGDVEPSGEGELKVLVTYDPCGGEVTPESQEKVYKTIAGVQPYQDLPVPTKEDATFNGWFTEAEGGSKVISETTIISQNPHTLYAHWKVGPAEPCIVTFDSQGGSLVEAQTVESGQMLTRPTDPVWKNHIFTGWYTDAEVQNKYDFSTPVTSSFTLYAGWQEKPAPVPTPTPVPNPDYKDTWIPTTDGGWYYEDDNGYPVVNEWKVIEDKTYKFDSEGYALQSEWYFENDAWYYFDPDCAMEEGSWVWLNGAWYAFNWDGTMCTGWTWDNDYVAWYYVRSDGSLVYGSWEWIDGAWYGFNWDGTMCTGWTWDNASVGWYYCYSSGVMARNTWIDGCYLNNSGRWIR